MGSVVAILSLSGRPAPGAIDRMIRAAPHRGLEITSASIGKAVVAVGTGDGIWSQDVAVTDELVVAVSGAIDNWRDIAREVEAAGHAVPAESPAGAVLAAVRSFGFTAIGRLRGVFEGVATDGESLWCFRDHIGFRPFFMQRTGDAVVVATEIKQVVAGSSAAYEPDIEVLELGFFGRLGDDRQSGIRGVERIRPGTVVQVDQNGTRTERFWTPESLLEAGDPLDTPGEFQERFDYLLTQAVRRSLSGRDVLSLSGGIDSTALGAYAAPVHLSDYGRPLPALSTVYPEFSSVDESGYIETAAQRFGTPLNTYVSQVSPTDRLEEWVRLCDGPISIVALSETEEHLTHAKSLGYHNALTGELAEAVFDMRGNLLPHLLAKGQISAAIRHMGALRSRGTPVGRIARQVVSAFLPASLGALRGRRNSSPVRGPSWIDPKRIPPPAFRPAREHWAEDQLVAFRGPGQALEADDFVQSLVGVTIRRPWADIDLWEFFLGLPAAEKFPDPWSKSLVRSLLRHRVPDVILDRRDKTVFDEYIAARMDYAPLRKWLLEPSYRVKGVDYRILADRLHQQDLSLMDFMWAKDLAALHAFLAQW